MKMKLFLCVILGGLTVIGNGQTTNTSPLPTGETVIGGHMHAGAGNEVWTDAGDLYFNYRGNAKATYFWNLGGSGGNSILSILNDGNVGIGTNTPRQALHVKGRIFLEGTEGSTVMENYFHWRGHNLIFGTEAGTYAHNIVAIKPGGASEGSLFSVFEMYNAQGIGQNTLKIQLNSDGNSFFNGGNVGIGTTNPQNALDVNGTIRAKEVKVETGWADFVFAPTYKLRPLTEVEQFIKTNGHLPEIPKAEDVQQNGVNLGEMQTKLLQKVEELTLYSIEQEKANAALQQQLAIQAQENQELKEEMKELKKLLMGKLK